MMDIITMFELVVYLFTREYLWLMVTIYVIAHIAYVYYFWASGVPFPFTGVIPFIRVWHYRSLSGISIVLSIFYCLLSAAAWFLPSLPLWLAWLAVSFLLEFKFAQVCTDCNAVLYAAIPPYKLYYLVKEARNMIEE